MGVEGVGVGGVGVEGVGVGGGGWLWMRSASFALEG